VEKVTYMHIIQHRRAQNLTQMAFSVTQQQYRRCTWHQTAHTMTGVHMENSPEWVNTCTCLFSPTAYPSLFPSLSIVNEAWFSCVLWLPPPLNRCFVTVQINA
jgi:hypothetical protein